MKLLLGATAVAALLAGAPAFAQIYGQTSAYGNIGYSAFEGGGEADATLNAVTGRVGARFGPYFGAEAQASFGLGSEEIEGFDVKLDNELSAYAVGFLPVSPNADLIARIGYGRAEITADSGFGDVSVDGGGLALGVGGQYFFDGLNGVRVDYTRQEFENEDSGLDDGEINELTVAYTRKF